MVLYSHSRLGAFENCPQKYKLQYIDKIKSFETGVEAFLGQLVHEALRKLYADLRHSKPNSLDDLLAFYKKQWEKNWSDNIVINSKDYTREHYFDTGRKCLERYYERFKPFDQAIQIWIEEQVFLEIGGHKLQGYVDRADRCPDGSYEIHDYKTSGHLPSQAEMDEDRQLALYEIALRGKWKDVDKVRLVWHYLIFEKEIVSTRTKEQLEGLKKDIAALIKDIEGAKSFEPTPSALCDWCGYWAHCPVKKHFVMIEEMRPEEATKEDGFELVNEYAKLKEKERKLDAQLLEVKERIIEYARKADVTRIRGSSQVASVSFKESAGLPSKTSDEKGYQELAELVKAAGLWDEYSSLDSRALSEALASGELDAKLEKKLRALSKERESVSVRLAKLKEDDEE